MAWRSGQAYAQDLRDRVLAAQESIRDVAKRFGVSRSYVANARGRLKRAGLATPGVQCNHMPSKLRGLDSVLREQVAAVKDQTLLELRDWVRMTHGIQVSRTALWKRLGQLGLTLKKRHSMRRSKPVPM